VNFYLFRADGFSLCQKAHVKLSLLINFKELLETLFKDRVTERVSHHVVASCGIKARLHFEDTNLIKSCHKQVDDYACLLGSYRKVLVVFNSLF